MKPKFLLGMVVLTIIALLIAVVVMLLFNEKTIINSVSDVSIKGNQISVGLVPDQSYTGPVYL